MCVSTYVPIKNEASLHWHSSWQFLESCLESHHVAPKATAKGTTRMISLPPATGTCTGLPVL